MGVAACAACDFCKTWPQISRTLCLWFRRSLASPLPSVTLHLHSPVLALRGPDWQAVRAKRLSVAAKNARWEDRVVLHCLHLTAPSSTTLENLLVLLFLFPSYFFCTSTSLIFSSSNNIVKGGRRRKTQQEVTTSEQKERKGGTRLHFLLALFYVPQTPLHPPPSSPHFTRTPLAPSLSALTSSLISPGKSGLNKLSGWLWCSSHRGGCSTDCCRHSLSLSLLYTQCICYQVSARFVFFCFFYGKTRCR